PTALRAATWNLYFAPLVNPEMTWVVFAELNTRGDCGEPDLIGVTMYPVIPEPPLLAGAFHETVAFALPGTAYTDRGGPGMVGPPPPPPPPPPPWPPTHWSLRLAVTSQGVVAQRPGPTTWPLPGPVFWPQ